MSGMSPAPAVVAIYGTAALSTDSTMCSRLTLLDLANKDNTNIVSGNADIIVLFSMIRIMIEIINFKVLVFKAAWLMIILHIY